MSNQDVQCPVCRQHNEQEALESELVFFTGVESILKQDTALVEQTYEGLTKYDAHTAITLYAILLADTAYFMGQDALTIIQDARKTVLERLNGPTQT